MPFPRMNRHLGAGTVDTDAFRAAAGAVLAEFRANSRVLRLHCLGVSAVGDKDDGIYALELSRFAEPDWTWEGASAFRTDTSTGGAASYSWSGEVVEVDEVAARIYARISGSAPCVGEFFVKPYEFLADLNKLFNGDIAPTFRDALSNGLAGAMGALQPNGLQAMATRPELVGVWTSSWGYIWGPPGCGKTYTIGRQIAEILRDESERVLIVSTTNKATDEVALSIGRGMRALALPVSRDTVCRIGAGADIDRFVAEDFEELVVGGEAWLRRVLSALLRQHSAATDPAHRAHLMAQIQATRQSLSAGRNSVADIGSRVVVSTAFVAVRDLTTAESVERIGGGVSPFSTVIADEAGLLSRAAVAALSCWAAKRMVLVGDPRQLSPISKISRVLPSHVGRWIASSGLTHVGTNTPGMHLLTIQHRMHTHIRRAVSEYQYDGLLTDAPALAARPTPLHPHLEAGPRAIWYVLDEDDGGEPARIRAERGPGNKSWVRQRSRDILKRLMQAHPSLQSVDGFFITPFVAQARQMAQLCGELNLRTWRASTVHRQQGAEADVVIFDTVNAGSTGWTHEEWKRLINVGISRARHLLIVLATRAEMQQPYTAALSPLLSPQVLSASGGQFRWQTVSHVAPAYKPSTERSLNPSALGPQIEARKALRPVLSAEQQRLCGYTLDGKPRLVRGVAGSGKTAVLAHWVAKQLADPMAVRPIWVVYANAALLGLLRDALEIAWAGAGQKDPFPWHAVDLFHILDLLRALEVELSLPTPTDDEVFDFEGRAELLLAKGPAARCAALFLDEAQDFGDATLKLLAQLIEARDGGDPRARSMNIFYDNAQNVYGRGTPRWSELGLDMRGRSTVMKESFRSTHPVAEFALNVLYRLHPPGNDPDHRELVERDLIEQDTRNSRSWWRVRFNQVAGPPPEFRHFSNRDGELSALCTQIRHWIDGEGVRPGDIRVVVNDRVLRSRITAALTVALGPRVRAEEQRQAFTPSDNLVIVTTAHSLKGHESELLAVPCADKFAARGASGETVTLPHVLYVALTRARSLLYVSAIDRSPGSPGAAIVDALQTSLEDLRSVPAESPASTRRELHLDLLERVEPPHREWAEKLLTQFAPQIGPVCRPDGSIVTQPLFWLELPAGKFAFLTNPASPFIVQELGDAGFSVLAPGAMPPQS